MANRRIGIIMHGITGRMGYNQHLVRSILAIRDQGGVALANGDRAVPDPILVGRNLDKVTILADRHGLKRVANDVATALANPEDTIFFDAGSTQMRFPILKQAIEAGKHVYCEKPLSETLEQSLSLVRLARKHGVKSGVVQDKLYLPGLRKLRMSIDAGFFGRILSVRGEFGYWVFEGDLQPAQRPSWNYRKAEGGGIILDMLPHWRYVLDNLFGAVESVSCVGATHIPQRIDESGIPDKADADDSAYATFQLAGGVIAHINSSWAVRVRRDDLVPFQVDGTHGSAVAGLTRCYTQHRVNTPRPVWNPDIPQSIKFSDGAGGRILAHHISDWLVPTRDLLLDRGMMGDGVIDLRAIRSALESAGYHGPQEVEIFSAENWWKRPGEGVIATCAERYLSVCQPLPA